jgi:hypothetical protein
MPNACCSDPFSYLHSISDKFLNFCHLLACRGRNIAGIKDILIDCLIGLTPVDEILFVVEIAAGITLEHGHVGAFHKIYQTIFRDFIHKFQQSLIFEIFLNKKQIIQSL